MTTVDKINLNVTKFLFHTDFAKNQSALSILNQWETNGVIESGLLVRFFVDLILLISKIKSKKENRTLVVSIHMWQTESFPNFWLRMALKRNGRRLQSQQRNKDMGCITVANN